MKNFICMYLMGAMGALLVLMGVFGMTSPVVASTLSQEKLHSLVQEYQNRISQADNEIQTLEENLVWLEMKIETMVQLKKTIPSPMYTSVFYKKNRIQVLELSRERLADCLAKVQEQIPADSIGVGSVETDDPGEDQQNRVKEQLEAADLMDWFEVVEDQSVMAVKTRLPILFASGSAVIAEEYAPFLEKLAVFMKTHGTWAIVDGFTDTNPIKTKQFPSNFELGAARAANIVHALVDLGADPGFFKVSTTGQYRFPDTRPVSKDKTMERYVNITLIFDQKI